MHRDGVVAAGLPRLAIPGGRARHECQSRQLCSASRTRRARSPRPSWKPVTSAPPGPTCLAHPATNAPCVPAGVNSGTLPAMSTTSNVRPRSSVARSCSIHSTADEARRAAPSIDGSMSTPTTAMPRRANSHADPAGTTSRVEHRRGRRLERAHEGGFAVHVDAAGRERVEPGLILVAVPGHPEIIANAKIRRRMPARSLAASGSRDPARR